MSLLSLVALVLLPSLGLAATCTGQPKPANSISPIAAKGWQWAVVATGLKSPRSIEFDAQGRLVVVESGRGVSVLDLTDNGGTCVTMKSKNTIINSTLLNHGLAFDAAGKTIYASTSATAFSWVYDLEAGTASSTNATLVTGMYNTDHNTRTLVTSKFVNNKIYVSRGSNDNLDFGAADITAGRSQIKAFDTLNVPASGFDYSTQGTLLGWGLRNAVGIAEHPVTGGIYSVENSCDQYMRDGVDIHEQNPGEKCNFHGTLKDNTYAAQGSSYGYPNCFSAFNATVLPNNGDIATGTLFTNSSKIDYLCKNYTTPRLTFEAHMAPLDIKFSKDGSTGFVTFHGSWDRTSPSGYKLSTIAFSTTTGDALAPPNSTTSTTDIFYNADESKCTQAGYCFRPVGLAFDRQQRLFMSSDASGEIYVLVRDGTGGGSGNGNGTGNGTARH